MSCDFSSPPRGTPHARTDVVAATGSHLAKKSPGRAPWVVAVLALFCGVAATGWWMRSHGAQEETRAESTAVKSVLHLDTFVINLADADQKTYLRLGVDLGLDHPATDKEQGAVVPVALVRDTIVGVLAVAKPDELLTPNGKAKLKVDLMEALHQRAPALGVREIYFTEFLIQR